MRRDEESVVLLETFDCRIQRIQLAAVPFELCRKENELTNKFELSTESPSRLRVSGTHRFLPVK